MWNDQHVTGLEALRRPVVKPRPAAAARNGVCVRAVPRLGDGTLMRTMGVGLTTSSLMVFDFRGEKFSL